MTGPIITVSESVREAKRRKQHWTGNLGWKEERMERQVKRWGRGWQNGGKTCREKWVKVAKLRFYQQTEPECKASEREGVNNKDRKWGTSGAVQLCGMMCMRQRDTDTQLISLQTWPEGGNCHNFKEVSKLHCNTPTSLHHRFVCFNGAVWKMTNTHKVAGLPNAALAAGRHKY